LCLWLNQRGCRSCCYRCFLHGIGALSRTRRSVSLGGSSTCLRCFVSLGWNWILDSVGRGNHNCAFAGPHRLAFDLCAHAPFIGCCNSAESAPATTILSDLGRLFSAFGLCRCYFSQIVTCALGRDQRSYLYYPISLFSSMRVLRRECHFYQSFWPTDLA
jgi:hypothetical protein